MVSIGFSGVTLVRGGKTLLERAHLAIEPGQAVLVTGGRGSGKSLLLAAAAGVIEPREGDVVIAGRPLSSVRRGARPYLRRNLGYLPADPPFVREETALENVMLALGVRGFDPDEAEILGRRTLAQLGAEPLCDTVIADLSVGERRLVAVARALGGPPAIVVLDEPTAGLDRTDRDRVAEALLASAQAGAAVLCASNDASLAEALRAGGARQLRLDAGSLIGEHAHVRLIDGGRDGSDRGGVVLSFPSRTVREVS